LIGNKCMKINYVAVQIVVLVFMLNCHVYAADKAQRKIKNTTSITRQTASMIFEFVDSCDDNVSPEIEFYLKENTSKYWGTYWLQFYNEPQKTSIACEKGKDICFGAWLSDTSWGCGKGCKEIVKGACYTCQNAVISVGLDCN